MSEANPDPVTNQATPSATATDAVSPIPAAAPSQQPQDAPAADASPETAGAPDPLDESLLTGKVGAEAEAPAGPPEAYDLVMPEGVTVDAEVLEAATPVLQELALSNEQANKLAPLAAQLVQRAEARVQQALEAQILSTRKQWADAALADTEIGGTPENFEIVKATAARFLDRFAGQEFRQFLAETGLGNHPEMIRAAYRAGQAIGEDGDFVRTDSAPAPRPKAFHEKLYSSE